jgi:hypothetical protein
MPAAADLFDAGPPDCRRAWSTSPDSSTPAEERALAGGSPPCPSSRSSFTASPATAAPSRSAWHYAFDGSGLRRGRADPGWLQPLRERAAALAGGEAEAFVHALVIEYAPGAGIGWHRDRPVFGDVVGISLLAPAPLRFRRKGGGEMGALQPHRRAPLRLSAARRGAARMGAQHPAAGDAALFGDVADFGARVAKGLPTPFRLPGEGDQAGEAPWWRGSS